MNILVKDVPNIKFWKDDLLCLIAGLVFEKLEHTRQYGHAEEEWYCYLPDIYKYHIHVDKEKKGGGALQGFCLL